MATVIEILLKANTAQAQSGLKSFNSGLDQTIRGLTGFSISGLGVTAVISGLAIAVKKSVSEYSSYVEAVDKASQRMGMSVDVYTRLIEAADDARVSQEGLERALTMMQQKGLDPTVEGLKAVADKFVAIQDPSDRAAYMMDVYGKSWKEIEPLIRNGGDAIEDAMASIDSGLVITQENVDANKEYYQALDYLNDSLKAVTNEGLKDLMPGLIDSAKFLTKAADAAIILMEWNERLNGAYKAQRNAVTQNSGTYREYVNGLINAAIASGKLERAYAGQIDLAINSIGTQTTLNQVLGLTSQYAWEASRAVEGEAQSLASMALGAENAIQPTTDANAAIAASEGAASAGASALSGYNLALANVRDLNGEVATAQQNLADAQQAWNDNVAGRTVGLLDEEKIGTQNYQAALAAGDEIFGTSYLLQDNLNKALDAAAENYQKTGDLDSYKEALIRVKDQFQPLDDKIKAATLSLETLQKKALEMDGMVIDMIINIQQQGGITLPPGAPQPPAYVPPAGGVVVTPTPSKGLIPDDGLEGAIGSDFAAPGVSGTGTSGVVINIYATINNGMDATALAAKMAQAINRRR